MLHLKVLWEGVSKGASGGGGRARTKGLKPEHVVNKFGWSWMRVDAL
jgi:hypothetical protein